MKPLDEFRAPPMSPPPFPSLSAPVWASAFRPFYLLGALYAPLLMAVWAGAYLGAWGVPVSAATPLALWHGHEMLFGFAAAIITGIVLTALPSWAGTPEIRGGRLALLVALWLAGRLACWATPWLPPLSVTVVDSLLFAALFIMLAPQLWRAANPLYLLLLPILAAFFGANLAYHAGIAAADPTLAGLGLRAGVYAVIVLYVLKGGLLTPIFTGNALREKGRGDQAPFRAGLEAAAVVVVVVLAVLDLAAAPAHWTGAAAFACASIHAWRVARWQGWRVADVPLVLVMHLGFAWLIFAFALKAAAELAGVVPEAAWLHAFTVGSLGMMMVGLMVRVSLRHTGRPLALPNAMRVAGVLVFAAALARLAVTVHDLGAWAVALAALLWSAAFVIYLARFGTILVGPSVPRARAKRHV
ncbi:NnrS family protein [Aromatoleum buckelii]|uniref:NnrS family protein n=1 Tax=Aromatoleum buckelii TaxID=200254 RepID=A0ABX1N6Q1_9RHOO|nr:NnrS family protein [Aromatoleum buckelii]MCK0511661.1 NnrS family protein [Aromatoleum buckelii]